MMTDPLERVITNTLEDSNTLDDEETNHIVQLLEATPKFTRVRSKFELLDSRTLSKHLKPSIEEPPTLELKPLPSHVRYAFLGQSSTLPYSNHCHRRCWFWL